jgi:DNA-binding PadR family transcriptional regulator
VEKRSGISRSSSYLMLRRLAEYGYIEITKRDAVRPNARPRKVYSLTQEGRTHALAMRLTRRDS